MVFYVFLWCYMCYLMLFYAVKVETEAHECFTKIGQFYPSNTTSACNSHNFPPNAIVLLLLVLRIGDQRPKLMKVATNCCSFIPGHQLHPQSIQNIEVGFGEKKRPFSIFWFSVLNSGLQSCHRG